MKINKKQLQNIIMIVIVIIAMLGFSFLVKQKITKKNIAQNQDKIEAADIDLNPRPIEELFASEFTDVKNEISFDQEKCSSKRILEAREKAKEAKSINFENFGKLSLGDNCWRTYENDKYIFNFQDINDSISFYMEKDNYLVIRSSFAPYENLSFSKEVLTLEGLKEYLNMFNNDFRKLSKVRCYQNKNNTNIYIIYYTSYVWDKNQTVSQESINVLLGDNMYNIRGSSKSLIKDVLTTISEK